MFAVIRSALLLSLAMAGRISQQVFEEGKVKCGCNNKVGLLAPKEQLEGIDIAPDPDCAKPGVHASESPGRFCSCDKGKAKNWATAFNAAQKRLDDALEPKMQALKLKLEQMQADLGVVIDLSSLGKVKPKVTSFPRRLGEGHWVCCCQSQEAGKCHKNAEMENGWIKRGVHHKAPDRACEDEFVQPEANGTAVEPEAESEEVVEAEPVVEPEVEPVEPVAEPETGSDAEEEVVTDKEDETGSDAEEEVVTDKEDETGSDAEEEVVTDKEDETGSDAEEEDVVTDEEVTPPSPPAPESNSRAALLRQIQGGFKLKKTKEMPAPAPAPPSRDGLLKAIQGGVKLKPVNKRELPPKPKESTAHSDLMNQIKAGVQLKTPTEREPEVEPVRTPSLVDTLKDSPKFQALTEHMNSEPEEAEDEEDWDE